MTTWWSDQKIHATVDREYVERELGARHEEKLHSVLAFGDGLTDDSYFDWIVGRGSRFFLILNQLGIPERVFDIADRSLDDEDLPLSQAALWEYNLFGGKSQTLDKKFYREQFNFFIQELEPGGHVTYGACDVVPVKLVTRRPGIAGAHANDRVSVQGNTYTRKKVATSGDKGIDPVLFQMHLKALKTIRHSHLVSIWATYSQGEFNYALLTPSLDVTLKSFLDEYPKAFKSLEKSERREIILTWTYCLTSALAYIHQKGFAHQNIRPSTITIHPNNTIYLNDHSALKFLDIDEPTNSYSGELYEYAAPENWLRKPTLHETAALNIYLPGGGRTTRRIPKPPSTSSISSIPPGCTTIPPKRTASKSASAPSSRKNSQSTSSASSPSMPRPRNALITTFAPPDRKSSVSSTSSHDSKVQAADVFSLTAIILALISSLLGYSPKSFASYRCRANRQAGRGNAPPDASFHKNLPQVMKWIDKLAKDAGQKEKKDVKLWGAVAELVQVCRKGMSKDYRERIGSKELEQEVGGWVGWGLDTRRKCNCTVENDDPIVLEGTIVDSEEVKSSEHPETLRSSSDKKEEKNLKPVNHGDGKNKDWLPPPEPLFEHDEHRSTNHLPGLVDQGDQEKCWLPSVESPILADDKRSVTPSTVWGLEEVQGSDIIDEPTTLRPVVRGKPSYSAITGISRAEVKEKYRATMRKAAKEREEDWPLPPGTLTLERRVLT